MISVKNISYKIGDAQILKDINLEIPEGSIVGLAGINGAGKSTLLRLMSGVYTLNEGSVEYDGQGVANEKTREQIFFLPDDPYYTQQSTMKSIVEMYKVFYPSFDMSTYERLSKKFKIDEEKPLRSCSKGMRRQIYIAIAISIKPKYLLLDEAFDGLDPLSRHTVKMEFINMVENDGTTIIISSHSLKEIEDFCDTYAIIDNKTIVSSGDISDKVGNYCKFMLAFDKEVSTEIFAALPSVSITKNGKFITAVFNGRSDEICEKLQELSPLVMEELPFNFEEVFISEVQK